MLNIIWSLPDNGVQYQITWWLTDTQSDSHIPTFHISHDCATHNTTGCPRKLIAFIWNELEIRNLFVTPFTYHQIWARNVVDILLLRIYIYFHLTVCYLKFYFLQEKSSLINYFFLLALEGWNNFCVSGRKVEKWLQNTNWCFLCRRCWWGKLRQTNTHYLQQTFLK